MNSDIEAALNAYANRKIHAALNPAILHSINDADIELAVIDYIAAKLDGKYDQEQKILETLSPGARALYLTWMVEAEVNNGGFNQYYFNTDGKFADAAVKAFEYFGAIQHANLMKEASATWNSEKAEMARFKDAGTLDAFSESYEHTKLGPLDDRFYVLTESLSQLRVSRIRQTPEQFSGH